MSAIFRKARAASFLLIAVLAVSGQQSDFGKLDESGQIMIDGHSTPYLIRHLPVSSFPDLPAAIEEQLNLRGCLIPQTYEAHRPENVVHASLERPGSSDW
ncbi:MAG: hypothetical protein ABSF75_07975, partial [Terracidiphilus sp.]